MLEVLVVDRTSDDALAFLDRLAIPIGLHVTFIDTVVRARKSIKSKTYDLIMLGDRTSGGDIYDVGLEVVNSKRNKRKPVVCFGSHLGRATKMANLLKPYSLVVLNEDLEAVTKRLREHLSEQEGAA